MFTSPTILYMQKHVLTDKM